MGPYKKLWFTLIGVLIVTFSLLGYYGAEVYRKAPPIPAQVVAADGARLFTKDDILDGQTAWQSVGGMQLGSIWGHGAYQAPDWTARRRPRCASSCAPSIAATIRMRATY